MERLGLMIATCIYWAGCSQPTRVESSLPTVQPSVHCDIVKAALQAVVLPYGEQPLGLEKACVEKRSMHDGKIYVDARFTKGEELENIEVPNCQRDNYFIRFDWKNFVPSPTGTVVLLMLVAKSDVSFGFNAVIENSNWPSYPPDVYGLSPCGSAVGQVRLENGRWHALVTNPRESGM